MVKSFITRSPSQTKKLGEKLAREFLDKTTKKAVVIGLIGDLGGGKTTFLQGFAKGLGVEEKILSPTFVIAKMFKVQGSRFNNFYHFDCYRVQKPKEILDLEFKKIISEHGNVVAIEWADRIEKILPAGAIISKFKFIDKLKRRIVLRLK